MFKKNHQIGRFQVEIGRLAVFWAVFFRTVFDRRWYRRFSSATDQIDQEEYYRSLTTQSEKARIQQNERSIKNFFANKLVSLCLSLRKITRQLHDSGLQTRQVHVWQTWFCMCLCLLCTTGFFTKFAFIHPVTKNMQYFKLLCEMTARTTSNLRGNLKAYLVKPSCFWEK